MSMINEEDKQMPYLGGRERRLMNPPREFVNMQLWEDVVDNLDKEKNYDSLPDERIAD